MKYRHVKESTVADDVLRSGILEAAHQAFIARMDVAVMRAVLKDAPADEKEARQHHLNTARRNYREAARKLRRKQAAGKGIDVTAEIEENRKAFLNGGGVTGQGQESSGYIAQLESSHARHSKLAEQRRAALDLPATHPDAPGPVERRRLELKLAADEQAMADLETLHKIATGKYDALVKGKPDPFDKDDDEAPIDEAEEADAEASEPVVATRKGRG